MSAHDGCLPGRWARCGQVWPVGAGPGDPELATLKAVRLLWQADVVRLKGGDPSVFGRAAEELDACRRAGIACEIVPGVTAASAAAAALGAPLTSREHAQGVAFVTGHPKPGGPEPDWRALAASGLTLVIYMGVARAGVIAEALIGAGKPAGVAVAIVERASLPGQRVTSTSLGALSATLHEQQVLSPAVIVVGERLADGLSAFSGLQGGHNERLA